MTPRSLIETHAATGSKESLSCLMDAELEEAEAQAWIDRLCRDETLKAEWTALQCACDALHSHEVAVWHSDDFAGRIAKALESEPHVLAPGAARARHRLLRRVLFPAVAATAAALMLAVVVVPAFNPAGDGHGLPRVVEADPTASVPAVAHALAGTGSASALESSAEPRVIRSADLDRLLSAHRELSTGTLLPSAPYLRTASEAPPSVR